MSHVPQALTAAQAIRLDQAFRLLQQGGTNEAMSIARNAVMEAPRAPDVHHLLALCHMAMRDHREAEQAFRRALEFAPANPHILGNYANLLKSLGRRDDALRNYRSVVEAMPDFAQGWINLGLAALESGQPAQALSALDRAVNLQPPSALAWHALGNARRASGDLEGAEAAFRKAVKLEPSRAAAWINLGVVLRLLGRPAEALPCLEEARKSGYAGPELADTHSGALIDIGQFDAALEQVRMLTRSFPHYVPGHVTLAHLLWEYGPAVAPGEDPLAGFLAAAKNQPANGPLQLACIGFLLGARRAEDALEMTRSMRSRSDQPVLMSLEATALEILGRSDEAGICYEAAYRVPGNRDPAFLNAFTRHLLKAGKWDAAALRAAEATQTDPNNQEAWAYLGTAWRLLEDPREYWLCDYERLIASVEVEPPPTFTHGSNFFAALEATLEPMHKAQREPVHQSLRGGSQTPGQLFGRPDPVIAATQGALVRAIERHIATLPDNPDHPFLKRKARSVRFAGSWSVKLWSSGSHVNHIHSQGWMSSAFYVSLPPSMQAQSEDGGDRAGWIQFGQPSVELGLNLPPRRVIRPRVGYVALFPSYMWHGTVPFEDAAARVAIAFDMTPTG